MDPSVATLRREFRVCVAQTHPANSSRSSPLQRSLFMPNNVIQISKTKHISTAINTGRRVHYKIPVVCSAERDSPAKLLRQILELPGVHQGPACFDALSAKLVEKAGFLYCFTSGTSFPHFLYNLLIGRMICDICLLYFLILLSWYSRSLIRATWIVMVIYVLMIRVCCSN